VCIKETVLNDLCSRFLLNIPEEEKNDPIKLCYHIELAHWFYLDLTRNEEPTLPACSFKEFIATIFHHIPSLKVTDRPVSQLAEEYKSSKLKRPVCGGIILNEAMDKCLLVQSYTSTTWGFPKGKKEEGETDEDAAIREVYEEVGFDVRRLINKEWVIERELLGHSNRMYIIPGVSEKTTFETRTRREIGKIEWFDVFSIPLTHKDPTTRQKLGKSPNSFYLAVPFMKALREWIAKRKPGLAVPSFFKPGRSSSPRSVSPRKKGSSSGQRSSSVHRSSSNSRSGPLVEAVSTGSSLSPNVQQLLSSTRTEKAKESPQSSTIQQRRPSSPSTEVKSLLNLLKQDKQMDYFPSALDSSPLKQQQQTYQSWQHHQQQNQHGWQPYGGVVRDLPTPVSYYQSPLMSTSPLQRRKKTKATGGNVPTANLQRDQQFQLSQFTYSSPALKDFKFDMEDILTPFSLSVRSVKI
jgi:mRNA-decapping enzyme subunit 2